jgi:uncharacterized phiE125 gp8 family phage protein
MSLWLTLAEAKAHLFVDDTFDDVFIQQCIDTAGKHIEDTCDYVVEDAARTLTFCGFAPVMVLFKAPVRSISAVQYLDETDTLQTVNAADYRLGSAHGAPALVLKQGKVWPSAISAPDAVRVSVVCGPASAASLPMPVKHAGKLLVGHWYKHREAVTLGALSEELRLGVASLLAPYRQAWVG